MRDNTNLTFTLQGISEGNGKVDVIDTRQENVNSIMVFTFQRNDEKSHRFGMSVIGGFSTKYYSEIIHNMIQTIGRDAFMKAFMLAEIVSGTIETGERCGGADSLSPAIYGRKEENVWMSRRPRS